MNYNVMGLGQSSAFLSSPAGYGSSGVQITVPPIPGVTSGPGSVTVGSTNATGGAGVAAAVGSNMLMLPLIILFVAVIILALRR
jgi:hypothetical protein